MSSTTRQCGATFVSCSQPAHLLKSCSLCLCLASRIIVAVAVAIPTASLCINRRLYKIATIQRVNVSHGEVSSDVSSALPRILTRFEETTRYHRRLVLGYWYSIAAVDHA